MNVAVTLVISDYPKRISWSLSGIQHPPITFMFSFKFTYIIVHALRFVSFIISSSYLSISSLYITEDDLIKSHTYMYFSRMLIALLAIDYYNGFEIVAISFQEF
jgi:hypothetical protein